MKKHEHLSSAKAIIGLLVLGIAFVIFTKFNDNQDFFFQDPAALRNYVIFAIVAGGFLIGLYYLASQTTHPKAAAKASKSSKKKKK